MNKTDLIAKAAEVAGVTKKDAEKVVNALFGTQATEGIIVGTVADNEKVELIGFGSWEKRHRSARKGRNPQTGVELEIAEQNVPFFKAGKGFKDAVL